MAPAPDDMPFARICDNLDEGLDGADVVMALRIQRERISDLDGIPGTHEYFASYGVSHERMTIARPDAIVLHPGPMTTSGPITTFCPMLHRSPIFRSGPRSSTSWSRRTRR